MEIRIKEIINFDEYNSLMDKHLNDPMVNAKPKIEFSESIVGLIRQEIISYRILQKGIVEEDKEEIKIIAENGHYITNYNKTLHNQLKDIIEETEKFIEVDRVNTINKYKE